LLGAKTTDPQLAQKYIDHPNLADRQWFVYPETYMLHHDYIHARGISFLVSHFEERSILRADKEKSVYWRPSLQSPIILSVQAGEASAVLQQRDTWYEVRTRHGDIGWVQQA
jgi:hypothetical protein